MVTAIRILMIVIIRMMITKILITDNHIIMILMLIVTVLTIYFFIENFQPPQHPRPLLAYTKYSKRRRPAANERPYSITIKYCSKKVKNYLTIGTKYVKAVSH